MVQKKVNTFLLLYKCVSISKSYSMLLLDLVSLKKQNKNKILRYKSSLSSVSVHLMPVQKRNRFPNWQNIFKFHFSPMRLNCSQLLIPENSEAISRQKPTHPSPSGFNNPSARCPSAGPKESPRHCGLI